MDVQSVKVLILFGLLIGSFLIGFIPVKCIWNIRGRGWSSFRLYRAVISSLSCFAAGVFMATCLMDLLPEAREALEEPLHGSKQFAHYPVAEFIMITGLILMLTVEQTVKIYQSRQGNNIATHSHDIETDERSGLISTKDEFRVSYRYGTETETDSGRGESSQEANSNHNGFENSITMSVRTSESNSSTLRSILLLVALSLHSVFEGLAVGLQKQTTDVIEVFVGLSIHKVIIAFSLGMTLSQSRLSFWSQLRSIFTFAIASPIGISIGLIIVEYGSGSSSSLAEGILQGIACGTFLYVTFFEILQHELSNPEFRLLKTLFLFVGFLGMSGLFLLHEKH